MSFFCAQTISHDQQNVHLSYVMPKHQSTFICCIWLNQSRPIKAAEPILSPHRWDTNPGCVNSRFAIAGTAGMLCGTSFNKLEPQHNHTSFLGDYIRANKIIQAHATPLVHQPQQQFIWLDARRDVQSSFLVREQARLLDPRALSYPNLGWMVL